jgi:hypothetical protein
MDYATMLQGTMYQLLGQQFADIYSVFAHKRAEDIKKGIAVPALREYDMLMLYLTTQIYWRDNTDRFTIFMYKCGINMSCPEYIKSSLFKKKDTIQEALKFLDYPDIKDRKDALACINYFSDSMHRLFNTSA